MFYICFIMQLWLLHICLNCNFFMIFYYGVFCYSDFSKMSFICFILRICTMFASMAQRVHCGEFLFQCFIFIILNIIIRYFSLLLFYKHVVKNIYTQTIFILRHLQDKKTTPLAGCLLFLFD